MSGPAFSLAPAIEPAPAISSAPGITSTEMNSLYPRETQVFANLLRGSSEKQIAVSLHLSTHTVHEYMKRLHKKLGVQSRNELFARVIAHLVEVNDRKLDDPANDTPDPLMELLRGEGTKVAKRELTGRALGHDRAGGAGQGR